MMWLLKMLLPSGLSLIGAWLERNKATAEQMAQYNSFAKLMQTKGLLSVDLSQDYDNQGPPEKPAP